MLDLAVIVDHLNARLQAPTAHAAEREAAEGVVADLKRRQKNLVDALEATGNDPEVVARLKEVRRQLPDALARVEHLNGLSLGDLPDFTTEEGRAAWGATIQPILANMRATLSADPVKARQRLHQLVPDPITVTPDIDDAGPFWSFKGVASFEAVTIDLRDGRMAPAGVVSYPVEGQVRRGNVAPNEWLPGLGSNQRHPD